MEHSRIVPALAALLALLSPAQPHGGGHQPPEPEPPTVPSNPPPSTGGPGDAPSRPRTPGGAPPGSGGPAQPGGPGSPGPTSGPSVPATGLPGGGIDLSDWSTWWEINQHAFLELREALWSSGPATGDDDLYLGRGAASGVPRERKPSERELAERVGPALKGAAQKEGQPEVLSGLLTALGKLGETPRQGEEPGTVELLLRFLAHPNQQIRESAAVALGLCGGPVALRELAALLASDARARELSGGSPPSLRTRAFAAYALGVLGGRAREVDLQRYAVHQLANAIGKERASPELDVACVNALSLVELPARPSEEGGEKLPAAASREALSAHLVELLRSPELAARTRAHLPIALARSARGGASAELASAALFDLLARPKALERELLHGTVLGLGSLDLPGEAQEKAALRLLELVIAEGDLVARNFAWIALARIGGRASASEATRAAVRERLLVALARGKSREQPWAALALGVQGWHQRKANLAVPREVENALRAALAQSGSPSDAGAYALALGLCGGLSGAGEVKAKLAAIREDAARGNMALALGLMRDRSALATLQDMLPEASYRPELIRPLAIAIALLGDERVALDLARRMAQTQSSAVRAVQAWALAHVGDAHAIDPLLALLADPAVPELTRGIAALGLGMLCERTHLPWNSALARDSNYPAAPATLWSPEGGGALNIR